MGEFWEPGNKFGDPGTPLILTAAGYDELAWVRGGMGMTWLGYDLS